MLKLFKIEVPLIYNFQGIDQNNETNEWIIGLEKDIIWEHTYLVGKEEENVQFSLSCGWIDKEKCIPEKQFILKINNVLCADETSAFNLLEKEIYNVGQILSLLVSFKNHRKEIYQPKIQADYTQIKFEESIYKEEKRERKIIDGYVDEAGKYIIPLFIEPNNIGIKNDKVKVKVLTKEIITAEDFLTYNEIVNEKGANPYLNFVLEEYYSALGTEIMESKFFHLFTIIELVEKKYEDLAQAHKVLQENEINEIIAVVKSKLCENEKKEAIVSSIKERIGRITDIGRAQKLANILTHMNLNQIKFDGNLINIDKKIMQRLIDLRNKKFHGGVSGGDKKHISVENAVAQLMEICTHILQYMMER